MLIIETKCGIIGSNQERVACPRCGFLLARALPGTRVTDLLLHCRKCKRQVLVNISSEP